MTTFEEQLNQVLSTFPCDEEIQLFSEALQSGKYYLLITRMGSPELAVLSRIRQKYYSIAPKGDFVQRIFPFKEGFTLADIFDINKEIGETPMMVTRASKSRMTEEQLIAVLVPDPRKRMPTPREYNIYCFILASDAEAWRWIDDLNTAVRELNEAE